IDPVLDPPTGEPVLDPDTDLPLTVEVPDVPQLILDQEGETVTSSIGTTLSYDSRDFIFDPSSGFHLVGSVEYAGTFLRGDNNFVKGILDASQFFPLPLKTVFSMHGRLGLATGIHGTELPVGERFFVGGINTVRGFDFGEAGPIDEETGEIIGGTKELIFNFEFLFPLVPEANIKGVVFYDAGKGFDDGESISFGALRTSAGGGIRWISPIGPLRLEWGYNLSPEEGEQKSNLEFTIGTLF
ncbi:MAG TPA: BamA/TamA family outer membrane protein, partial [Nitrospiria bacterium]|nr:BamA/TamA family outer membrane protein [Nitrospiria bacterium]